MNKISLHGVVGWDIDAEEFSLTLESMTGDIEIDMNSGGGHVTDGISIMNNIRSYTKGTITAKVSYAASMMTQIALACDEVQVYDNAIFMIHNVQGMAYGDHVEMRKQADMQERMSVMLSQIYANKTGMSVDEVNDLMDADTYLFGKEIVDYKFADSVIDTDKDKNKESAIITSNIMFEKVKLAMKQEKLTASDMENNIKMCKGNCTLEKRVAAMPDNSKLVNSNIGASMFKFDRENLDATQDTFEMLVESRSHLNSNILQLRHYSSIFPTA